MTASTTLPPACKPIQLAIDGLKADRTALQEQLQEASTSQKPGLAAAIGRLTNKISQKNRELRTCKSKHAS